MPRLTWVATVSCWESAPSAKGIVAIIEVPDRRHDRRVRRLEAHPRRGIADNGYRAERRTEVAASKAASRYLPLAIVVSFNHSPPGSVIARSRGSGHGLGGSLSSLSPKGWGGGPAAGWWRACQVRNAPPPCFAWSPLPMSFAHREERSLQAATGAASIQARPASRRATSRFAMALTRRLSPRVASSKTAMRRVEGRRGGGAGAQRAPADPVARMASGRSRRSGPCPSSPP